MDAASRSAARAQDLKTTWTVTATSLDFERRWGVRLDWLGPHQVLAVVVNRAPAMRIVILGLSIQLGRLLPRQKTVTLTGSTP